jgi:hypothetical protein
MENATQRMAPEVAHDIAKVNARVSENIAILLDQSTSTLDEILDVPNQLVDAATELERLAHELHAAN